MINPLPASDLNARELPQDELDALLVVYKDKTQGSAADRAAAVVDAIHKQHEQLPSASSLVAVLGGSKSSWVQARSDKAGALQTEREQFIKDQAGNASEDLDSVIHEATTAVKTITDTAILTAMGSAIERTVVDAYDRGLAAGHEQAEALYAERLASVTAQRDSEHDEAVSAAGAEDAMRERLSQLSSEFDEARASAESSAREVAEHLEQVRSERDQARIEAAEAKGSLAVWTHKAGDDSEPKPA